MKTGKKCIAFLVFILIAGLISCGKEKSIQDGDKILHKIEISRRILVPEEGLLLGNGDLSVSIYQTSNAIIWRFGKNDVWDRRHDTTEDPEPAHINEIANGILNEGWVNNSFNKGEIISIYGKPVSKRAQEICSGTPSYAYKPYPCPKPTGELAFHLPMDQKLVSISQVLTIEKAIATIELEFESGVTILLECFIPPDDNVLVVDWKVDNWNDETSTGSRPCYFSLYRWADQQTAEFAKTWRATMGNADFMRWADPTLSPLPPPVAGKIDTIPVITQRFHPDFDSEEGFSCVLVPLSPECGINALNNDWEKEARLQILPDRTTVSGNIAVAVVTGDDPGLVKKQCQEIITLLGGQFTNTIQSMRNATIEAANEFWQRSEVITDDPFFNAVWYETLHAKRSTFRADVIAPGLYLPSTLNDYSLWHGDYHTNYNYQSAFWGRFAANQIDLGDSFFPGVKYMVDLGRDLAKKYWDSDGVFFHLLGYPFTIREDPYGVGSICRMAYMTGWMANHYWYRYLYTMDTEWLEKEGYPVIHDAAVFYADFLEKGEDGKYHAFPSGQGEYHFTGDPKDYTDMPQVIRHARYLLQIAAEAAKVLNTDDLECQQWEEIAENIADVDSLDQRGYTEEDKARYLANSPEFFAVPQGLESTDHPRFLRQTRENQLWSRYFGQFPMTLMENIRNGNFVADRDYTLLQEILERWRLPNGLFRGMSQYEYGYQGAMSECLGILGPMSEMLLQSWEGTINVFPAWPGNLDATFRDLRARGAFLLSSELKEGKVQYVRIISESGGDCNIVNPWDTDKLTLTINGVGSRVEAGEVLTFATSRDDSILIKPRCELLQIHI